MRIEGGEILQHSKIGWSRQHQSNNSVRTEGVKQFQMTGLNGNIAVVGGPSDNSDTWVHTRKGDVWTLMIITVV